jgi:hypothetical protein
MRDGEPTTAGCTLQLCEAAIFRSLPLTGRGAALKSTARTRRSGPTLLSFGPLAPMPPICDCGVRTIAVEDQPNKAIRIDGVVEEAKSRLRAHPHLAMQRLWFEREGNRLVIRGQVPSFYYKQLAQEAVLGLHGVTYIVNDVEVVW